MLKRFGYILLVLVLSGYHLMAQTTFIPLWAKEGWLLDRMEIKAQTNNHLNLSTVKPYMRKVYVAVADSFSLALAKGINTAALTPTDQYNLDRFQANNSEFSVFDTASRPQWKSRKSLLGFLWPTKGNMIEVDQKDFYLSINPAINQQQSMEQDFGKRVFVNSKGVVARGMIADRIGFHFFLTDNQEQGPLQFREFVDSVRAVPGNGFWKRFKTNKGVDYFDARGSISWNVSPYVNMQFGYDQQFIGNGYRSLFYSNFSPNSLFLKWNTRFWKLNYTNLFMEIFPYQTIRGDKLLDRKYVSMHHLSVNVLPWLNVGLFESMIFGDLNKFRLSNLQPVILLNSLLARKDGANNANIGLDFKANLAKKVQVYGQYLFDNLDGRQGRTGPDWWGNKHAYQLGAKYVDVLGVKNLDIQLEYNQVRPFTYSGADSTLSYTHYRQPMAHPMGGNVREIIGVLRYQPFNKLYLFGRLNYWTQGLDSARYNFGSYLLQPNTTVAEGGRRLRDDGFTMFSGIRAQGLNASFTASYEVKENLFLDLSGMYRIFDKADAARVTTTVATLGIRWNMFRRDYDY